MGQPLMQLESEMPTPKNTGKTLRMWDMMLSDSPQMCSSKFQQETKKFKQNRTLEDM